MSRGRTIALWLAFGTMGLIFVAVLLAQFVAYEIFSADNPTKAAALKKEVDGQIAEEIRKDPSLARNKELARNLAEAQNRGQ